MNKILLILIIPIFAFSTTFKKTDINKLFKSSTLVVEAKITSKQSAWSGKKIYTQVQATILQTFKGQAPLNIQFQMLGGRVGSRELIIHGNPAIEAGETVLLFLVYHKGKYALHSMAMGYFDVNKSNPEKIYFNKYIPKELLVTGSANKIYSKKPSFTINELQKVMKRQ